MKDLQFTEEALKDNPEGDSPSQDNPVPPRRTGRPITNTTPEAEARRKRDAERKRKQRERDKATGGRDNPDPRQRSLDDEVNDIVEGYAEAVNDEGEAPKEEGPEPGPAWANGAVLILAMDMLFPPLIAWAAAKKGVTLNPDRMRYSDEEKAALAPAADEAAKYISARIHPVAAFLIVAMGTTFAKAGQATVSTQEG